MDSIRSRNVNRWTSSGEGIKEVVSPEFISIFRESLCVCAPKRRKNRAVRADSYQVKRGAKYLDKYKREGRRGTRSGKGRINVVS